MIGRHLGAAVAAMMAAGVLSSSGARAAEGAWLGADGQDEAPTLPQNVVRNVDGLTRSEAKAMKARCRPILTTSEAYGEDIVALCRLLQKR
jgi:hypothetical protein